MQISCFEQLKKFERQMKTFSISFAEDIIMWNSLAKHKTRSFSYFFLSKEKQRILNHFLFSQRPSCAETKICLQVLKTRAQAKKEKYVIHLDREMFLNDSQIYFLCSKLVKFRSLYILSTSHHILSILRLCRKFSVKLFNHG